MLKNSKVKSIPAGINCFVLFCFVFFSEGISLDDHTGEILKRSGVSILLSSVSNACAFFAAAIIPIPALRAFSLQAGILVLFNLATLLSVFPAIMSLDMKRRAANRVDLLCCFSGDAESNPPVVKRIRNSHCHSRSETCPVAAAVIPPPSLSKKMNRSPPRMNNNSDPEAVEDPLMDCGTSTTAAKCRRWTLSSFARDTYSRYLLKTPVKVLGVTAYIVVLTASVWGATKVKNGLNLTDIVPHQTAEYGFLAAHDRYFGFYNMFAVTQGNFEYPNNQRYNNCNNNQLQQ